MIRCLLVFLSALSVLAAHAQDIRKFVVGFPPARFTLACGDTVNKIAAECGVKTLVLTRQSARRDDATLQALTSGAQRDFTGRPIPAQDLDEVVVGNG